MMGWLARRHICIVMSGTLNMRNVLVQNMAKVKRAVPVIESRIGKFKKSRG